MFLKCNNKSSGPLKVIYSKYVEDTLISLRHTDGLLRPRQNSLDLMAVESARPGKQHLAREERFGNGGKEMVGDLQSLL